MLPGFSDDHISTKLKIMQLAQSYLIPGETVEETIDTAKKIEAYVFSGFDLDKKKLTQVKQTLVETEEQRAKFLATLETSCDNGHNDCNGSKETCKCQ